MTSIEFVLITDAFNLVVLSKEFRLRHLIVPSEKQHILLFWMDRSAKRNSSQHTECPIMEIR